MVTKNINSEDFINKYEENLEENDFWNLRFENVSKKYKRLTALENVSLEIKRGDLFGYIGPNGAGKTTTLKIMVGLIKDYSGKYFINDKLILRNVNELFYVLGYHPQDTGFQIWRTVDHALYTFGRLSGIDRHILKERIYSLLQFVGLLEFKNTRIKHLSGGMVQKLRLAQALINFPKIIILDEPLSGLDPASRFQIKALIKTLAQKEITILFSSHILNDVEDIANKIGILNHGQIIKVGTPNQLQEEFQVAKIIEIIYSEPKDLCNDLTTINEIERIEVFDTKQLLYFHPNVDLDEVSHKILGYIFQQKCRIRSFRFLKPSLENVYLKYVSGDIK